jgi:DNA-binding MarR family transcriptional regulator
MRGLTTENICIYLHSMGTRSDTSALSLCASISRDCTSFNLRKAARAVSQFYDSALQGSGLRGTQFSLLAGIYQHGPVTINDLSDGMVMDQTTVSRNVRVLQKHGYVEMVPGADRRTRGVSITPKGKRALEAAIPLWKRAQAHMAIHLGEKRIQALLGELEMATKVARQT